MAFSRSTVFVAFTLLTSIASAVNIKIIAQQAFGNPDPFEFSPNEINAAIGDILEFHFVGPANGVLGSNMSVAQGVFGDPCKPAAGGFWSGFMGVNATSAEADMVFNVEVNSTDPIAFYCAQGPHCARGMHGVVNGAGDQTLRSYRNSIDVNFDATIPTEEPGFGGELVANNVSNIIPAVDPNAAGSIQVSLIATCAAVALTLFV
ncbi:uncharacterized protein HMPREF1541_04023 [Cyphellophora europaea CBS 101466]|uniref:Blue (type 1) copper domain-containing protein n=1 Tax=Cyphellophora europaea (strain CBS 101466) TaxID=1220924 RepID=W2S299_CYPE1|nr:uncharacterized protein HMPREF1541_04023 [Cyphellophora europaea CBS 101466]ETN42084.1 hypothetical protein HMPREF1541_04023 [Cyphellophora europaea CBS 101466]